MAVQLFGLRKKHNVMEETSECNNIFKITSAGMKRVFTRPGGSFITVAYAQNGVEMAYVTFHAKVVIYKKTT